MARPRKTTTKASTAPATEAPVKETPVKEAPVIEAAVKTAAKKTSARKPAAKKSTVYVQFAGRELETAALIEAAKEDWNGKKSDIKTISLYIKPEECKAYYVINDTETGSINL